MELSTFYCNSCELLNTLVNSRLNLTNLGEKQKISGLPVYA